MTTNPRDRLTVLLGNVLAALTAIAIAIAVLWGFGLAADNHTARHDPASQYYVAPRR